jgi:aryl-alcohol dehydrogenase-like predicted oxidoreductase
MEQSLKQLKVDKVGLMQVHSLGGVDEMLQVLREWKAAGKDTAACRQMAALVDAS